MKYKTLFRVILKAIGVWLFATGLSQFFQMVIYLLGSLSGSSGMPSAPTIYLVIQATARIATSVATTSPARLATSATNAVHLSGQSR